MAEIQPELIHEFHHGAIQGRVVHWDNIGQGDTCAPYEAIGLPDKDVEINGTADGGSLAIHGANHPTDPVFSVVKDNADNEITGITSGHYTVVNHTHSVKPVLTGGGASTDFNVTMIIYTGV